MLLFQVLLIGLNFAKGSSRWSLSPKPSCCCSKWFYQLHQRRFCSIHQLHNIEERQERNKVKDLLPCTRRIVYRYHSYYTSAYDMDIMRKVVDVYALPQLVCIKDFHSCVAFQGLYEWKKVNQRHVTHPS